MTAVSTSISAKPNVLVDTFGRVAGDLRISITDRCDLRCRYCMPAEGLDWIPRPEVLTADEIETIARVFFDSGIRSVRVTGGEPLVRADAVDIVERLVSCGFDDISLTTNGTRLARLADDLARVGLRRVNVSLDSLQRERYFLMTRRDAYDKVIAGLEAAQRAGLSPIKINCVVMRGVNDDELVDFATLARDTGHEVRFIEPMPLDGDRSWDASQVVSAAEIVARINSAYPIEPADVTDFRPATMYRFSDGAPGAIGVIGSVSQPFCGTCDRLRLTADGQMRTCLFAHEELNLRDALREGATAVELSELIGNAVWRKGPGHDIGNVTFRAPERSMSRIGG